MKKLALFTVFSLAAMSVISQNYIKIDASFYSPALDENKMIDIYLPKDYYVYTDTLEKDPYPVIYFLHGARGDQNSGFYAANTYYGNHYADTAITSPAAIFVCPDGSCDPYLGSMWLNSELYGNYEDYVINDLIDFTESNFRVVKDKNFRFIHGHSMGGFGSVYLATKYPDLFRAACPSAGAFSMPDTFLNSWRNFLYEENNGFYLEYSAGVFTQLFFTLSGGYSPNMSVEPSHIECLYDTLGNVVDTVFEKWQNFMTCKMIKDIPPENNLAYFLICGVEDEFIFYPSNVEFTDTLQKYGRHYQTAWHNYGHTVFDPVTHKIMFSWVDSLIAESYTHLGTPEFQIPGSKFQITCFPNPFTEIVHIEYEIENPSPVSIQVFNAIGEKVSDLQDGFLPKGKHLFSWNAQGLPAGLYFCRVQVGGEVAVLKILRK